MELIKRVPEPSPLLIEYLSLFTMIVHQGPILDVAGGNGRNSVYLARALSDKKPKVICSDISNEALNRAQKLAHQAGVAMDRWRVDLEQTDINPLPQNFYSGILVFNFLHRPLIPCLKKSLTTGGVLLYETFTKDNAQFGKPKNPDFLLDRGELAGMFKEWKIIYSFEGIAQNPQRAIAQIVCRKM